MCQNIRTGLYLFAFTILIVTGVIFYDVPRSYAETKIVVVDVQRLLRDSDAAQSIQEQLLEHRDTFQEELTAREKELMLLEKDILSRKEGMSQAELEKERQGFEKKLIEAKKIVQKRGNILEKAVGEGTLKLRTEIVKIVAEMSEQEDYTMVITKQNVILAKKELDITDKVMKKLNKELKTIKLKVQSQ